MAERLKQARGMFIDQKEPCLPSSASIVIRYCCICASIVHYN